MSDDAPRQFVYQLIDEGWNGRSLTLLVGHVLIADLTDSTSGLNWSIPQAAPDELLRAEPELLRLVGSPEVAAGWQATAPGVAAVLAKADQGPTFQVTASIEDLWGTRA